MKAFKECRMQLKAIPDAIERISVLNKLGFVESQKQLIGHDGTAYKHYWVKQME